MAIKYQIIERNGLLAKNMQTPIWIDDGRQQMTLNIGDRGVAVLLPDEARKLARQLAAAARRAEA